MLFSHVAMSLVCWLIVLMASSQVPNNVTVHYSAIGYTDVTYGTKLRFRGTYGLRSDCRLGGTSPEPPSPHAGAAEALEPTASGPSSFSPSDSTL
jgi:hypothetical protein